MMEDRQHVRKWAAWPLLAFGLVCLIVATVNLSRDISLWVLGRRTTAQVTDAWVEQSDSGVGASAFTYFIRYEFTTLHDKTVTGLSRVGAQEWAGLGMGGPVTVIYQEQTKVPQYGIGGLEPGNPVAVVYFPLCPAHNRLDEARLVPVLACSYVPLILLGWGALLGGRHLLRNT